ncbi:GyrI-like domain-containing protein [Dyadobacter sp. LJ53]|uniref:GyrI-like domain-containing protein n=1 Tax=Dyadobacter chenwenxiniae TaxID=2906456 RepID=UPI001F34433C|nr:GyrI-like domain-containing protein [Dyadobacter chenwenxiniae]MCF0050550.1 GyrI-like domain-containing protein [Dyadobacter chenwenxiniae]
MLSEPKTERREELHYLSIRKTVHMHNIPDILPPLIPEVKEWMQERNIEAAGVDFFLYKSMNEKGELDCEAGFPVGKAVEGDERVAAGSFPAGHYASIIYTGHFKDMMQAHVALEKWIKEKGFTEKARQENGRTEWGGRTEFYLVDPDFEPNPDKWQTEIVFLLED